jgi:cyclophilin family peptidyl-prolyl cis-trans isomerase
MGTYSAVLDAAKAPGTVNNFVSLARNKYFDGTTCHRAIPGFMIQCGDPTATGSGGPGYKFADELPASGEYKIGSLAMANSGPDTNGSQFFVISGDQGVSLPPSYTLFGQVTDGLDSTVVALDAAGNDDPSSNGVPPLKEIKIESITITES